MVMCGWGTVSQADSRIATEPHYFVRHEAGGVKKSCCIFQSRWILVFNFLHFVVDCKSSLLGYFCLVLNLSC